MGTGVGMGMDPTGTGGNVSELSLRDNVDYSRPFGGFVSNRMDSSTTVATADTRTTQMARTPQTVPHSIPPSIDVPEEHADERSQDHSREKSYFSPSEIA
jgi:hypothetical protein